MTPIIAFLTVCLIVIPQWVLMIIKPNSKWTQRLVDSDLIPFLLLIIYVITIARNRDQLQFDTVADLFNVFQLENTVLGAWAFVGFITLLIGGWVFNRVDELAINVQWAMSSLFTFFIIFMVTVLALP